MSPVKAITAGLICLAILAGGAMLYFKKPKPVALETTKALKKTRKVTPQKGLPPIIEETEEVIDSAKPLPIVKNHILGLSLGYDQKIQYNIIFGKRWTGDLYIIGKAQTDLSRIEAGVLYVF
jgi:hypothetical protein